MAIDWAGLGPELLLRLDRDSDQPLRSQLETGLRDVIRDGRLQAGERLPSSRELARELGVSRGLVQECYGQLLSEGYLDSRVGSATRVALGAYPGAYPVRESAPARVPAPPAPATRAAAARCARWSPDTCGGCGPPPPGRRTSSSAPASRRGSTWSCGC